MIDTVALRKRILDLAIQGLLTPDVTVDEDVKLKVNSILIENGIENDIDLSDILYEIKNTWCWIKLGWIMGIERGGSPRPIKAYITDAEDGINWIKIGDVSKDGKYIEKTKEKIKPEGEKKSRHVYPGDFLLTNSMSFGRPYISKIDGCVHDGWLILRNTEELFDMDFLYHLLSSSYAYNQFSKKASGATVDNLNIDKVADAIIQLPPIEEQKIIVEKVEEMMQHIETISNLQTLYSADIEVLKSKIIDAGIQGKLTEQLPEDGTAEELLKQIAEEKKIKATKALPEITEDEIPFAIPGNWKWARLADLTANEKNPMADGPFGSNLKKEHYTEKQEVRIIQLSNVGREGWRDENKKYTTFEHLKNIERSAVNAGDIVIAKMMPAGRAIIVPDIEKQFVLSSDCVKFVPNPKVNSWYLYYAINSDAFRNQVHQTITGVGRERTSLSKLKDFLIPLPPYDEQIRIVDKLEEVLAMM